MKRQLLSVFGMVVTTGLLVLAGCDNPVNDDGIWLDEKSNPFIGTWTASSTNMSGVTTTITREFKTDGTIAVTTKTGDSEPVSSTAYYLVKDDILVISQTNAPFYIKYRFTVIDNNSLRVVQDATGSAANYTRAGDENSDAGRVTALANGISGYWRASNSSAATMYDWYEFKNDGTYHVYHWMKNDPHYIDRGDFSYYIDAANNFVSITGQYTVRVFTGFTRNNDSSPKTIGWNDGSNRTFYEFDGVTFAIP